MSTIRILAVDDHPLLRGGIAALIDGQPDMQLCAEASTGVEAIERYRESRPDVTLLDIQMPLMDGIETLTAIRKAFPGARVIILTTYGGDALALRAIKAGAQAYVLKGSVRTELLDTIRSIHRGHRHVTVDVASALNAHRGDESLSPREIDVLRLAAAGNSNHEIGMRLSVSMETAKAHMKHIMAKLGANDRTHAVTLALARGILPSISE